MVKKISLKKEKFGKSCLSMTNKTLLVSIVILFLSVFTLSSYYLWMARNDGSRIDSLQTDLADEIRGLKARISALSAEKRKLSNCINPNLLADQVCEGYLDYKPPSENCPIPQLTFGTKNCCEKMSEEWEGKVVECDYEGKLFAQRSGKVENQLVKDSDQCYPMGDNPCKYHPKEGWHCKVSSPDKCKLERDCEEGVVSRTGCSEACGGGMQKVIHQTKLCEQFATEEVCNTQPCSAGFKEVTN